MAMASSREPPGELRRMVEDIFTARLDLPCGKREAAPCSMLPSASRTPPGRSSNRITPRSEPSSVVRCSRGSSDGFAASIPSRPPAGGSGALTDSARPCRTAQSPKRRFRSTMSWEIDRQDRDCPDQQSPEGPHAISSPSSKRSEVSAGSHCGRSVFGPRIGRVAHGSCLFLSPIDSGVTFSPAWARRGRLCRGFLQGLPPREGGFARYGLRRCVAD